jgi:hypothetical protein
VSSNVRSASSTTGTSFAPGLPRSRCPRTHLRTRFAFNPLASATAASDAPGTRHFASTASLCALLKYRRPFRVVRIGSPATTIDRRSIWVSTNI